MRYAIPLGMRMEGVMATTHSRLELRFQIFALPCPTISAVVLAVRENYMQRSYGRLTEIVMGVSQLQPHTDMSHMQIKTVGE